MRGADISFFDGFISMRITPAYAGSRPASQISRAASRDHPRVCGEQLNPMGGYNYTVGSPPRMRGAVKKGFLPTTGRWITPAYAGSS